MFGEKNTRDEIIKFKQRLEDEYISFLSDGSTTKDSGESIQKRGVDKLGGWCSYIDYFVENGIRDLVLFNIDFDAIDYELMLGTIYNKSELGKNNEILPTSTPMDGVARYYTGKVIAYKDNEIVYVIEEKDIMGHQGFIKYDDFVNSFKEKGLSFNGPETFEALKEAIINKEQFPSYFTIDFTQNLNHTDEPKKKEGILKRTLFKKSK